MVSISLPLIYTVIQQAVKHYVLFDSDISNKLSIKGQQPKVLLPLWIIKLVQRCRNNSEYSARYFCQHKAEEGGDAGCIVDWRQRGDGGNSGCCIHCYFCNAVLASLMLDYLSSSWFLQMYPCAWSVFCSHLPFLRLDLCQSLFQEDIPKAF